MVLSDRVIYAGFSYTGVCTIYQSIYDITINSYSYQVELTVGEIGKSGSAVVKFDINLNPTLVSNYTA